MALGRSSPTGRRCAAVVDSTLAYWRIVRWPSATRSTRPGCRPRASARAAARRLTRLAPRDHRRRRGRRPALRREPARSVLLVQDQSLCGHSSSDDCHVIFRRQPRRSRRLSARTGRRGRTWRAASLDRGGRLQDRHQAHCHRAWSLRVGRATGFAVPCQPHLDRIPTVGALAVIDELERVIGATLRPHTLRCRLRPTGIEVQLDPEALARADQPAITSLAREVMAARRVNGEVSFTTYQRGSAFRRPTAR